MTDTDGAGTPDATSTTTTDQAGADPSAAAFSQADVDRIVRERLTRDRARFADYDQLKTRAAEADALREHLAGRDAALAAAAAQIAVGRRTARLARAGVDETQAGALLAVIDPQRLLADGAPSDDAIEQVAAGLARAAGRIPRPRPGARRGRPGRHDRDDPAPRRSELTAGHGTGRPAAP
ncbi:MAG: hypothetical protein ACT4RN_19550 [Pseudonocardia sp.]